MDYYLAIVVTKKLTVDTDDDETPDVQEGETIIVVDVPGPPGDV